MIFFQVPKKVLLALWLRLYWSVVRFRKKYRVFLPKSKICFSILKIIFMFLSGVVYSYSCISYAFFTNFILRCIIFLRLVWIFHYISLNHALKMVIDYILKTICIIILIGNWHVVINNIILWKITIFSKNIIVNGEALFYIFANLFNVWLNAR